MLLEEERGRIRRLVIESLNRVVTEPWNEAYIYGTTAIQILLFQVITMINCNEKKKKKTAKKKTTKEFDLSRYFGMPSCPSSADLMKKRIVVTKYIVCGTVTVRFGMDTSVRDSKSNRPMMAKKIKIKINKQTNKTKRTKVISG